MTLQMPSLTEEMIAAGLANQTPADPVRVVVERAVIDADITIGNLRAMKQEVNSIFSRLERAAQQYKEETRACMDAFYATLHRKDQ